MAKATMITTPVVPIPPKTEVYLVLSKSEAEALISVLGKVGGSPTNSRRKYTQAVYNALLGLNGLDYRELGALDIDQTKSIWFKESIL